MRNQDVELNPVAPGVIQTEHNGKLNRGFDCLLCGCVARTKERFRYIALRASS
jgi:hypothetical protein